MGAVTELLHNPAIRRANNWIGRYAFLRNRPLLVRLKIFYLRYFVKSRQSFCASPSNSGSINDPQGLPPTNEQRRCSIKETRSTQIQKTKIQKKTISSLVQVFPLTSFLLHFARVQESKINFSANLRIF